MIQSIKSLDRILKGQATDVPTLRRGTIDLPIAGLTVLLVLLGALYGVCMGTFAVVTRWGVGQARLGFLQMAYSAAKVPMLFILTLAVTFPSLYVFNALVGCRLLMSAVLRLLVAALGVTLAVLASFGTIIAFFSLCTTSYPFMVLLNVVTFALAGLLGMNFLLQTLHRLSVAQAAAPAPAAVAAEAPIPSALLDNAAKTPQPSPALPPPVPPPSTTLSSAAPRLPGALDRIQGEAVGRHVRRVFGIWVIVFALVGAQMGWILRPFIGAPHARVTFFRSREGNFFQAVVDKIENLANGTTSSPSYRKSDCGQ